MEATLGTRSEPVAKPPKLETLETLRLSPGYSALGPPYIELRDPSQLPDPYPIAFNPDVAALIGLDPAEAARPEFLKLSAGNARFGAVESFAAVYAGHQFGSFVPQLGDGRAITLAEVETSSGDRFEWQIKGGGSTSYSRFGDGRAVLRSTIREYLCSEAMAALGIPTTRALAIRDGRRAHPHRAEHGALRHLRVFPLSRRICSGQNDRRLHDRSLLSAPANDRR
jgi:uncharacterized protein YdiU (UPF0061 family)